MILFNSAVTILLMNALLEGIELIYIVIEL